MGIIIYISISIFFAFLIAGLRLAIEEAAIKAKENNKINYIVSWLFLFPIFARIYAGLEKLHGHIIRSSKSFMGWLRDILALGIFLFVVYLVYKLISMVFS